MEVGAVRPLFGGIVTGPGASLYDVADAFWLPVPAASQKAPQPITLIQNWTAALKR